MFGGIVFMAETTGQTWMTVLTWMIPGPRMAAQEAAVAAAWGVHRYIMTMSKQSDVGDTGPQKGRAACGYTCTLRAHSLMGEIPGLTSDPGSGEARGSDGRRRGLSAGPGHAPPFQVNLAVRSSCTRVPVHARVRACPPVPEEAKLKASSRYQVGTSRVVAGPNSTPTTAVSSGG